MDVDAMYRGAQMLTRPATEYDNDANVEAMWAVRAGEYAELHFNLLCSVPEPRLLKLTKHDDRIYDAFLCHFPDFKLSDIYEESLKSPKAKEKWRIFCEGLKDIEDYSFGTLLRLDAKKEYSPDNTILVARIQFLAIEIARNRHGFNNYICGKNCIALAANDDEENKNS